MIETIVTTVLSLVTWLIGRSQKAKVNAAKYVDYIKQWIKNTPSSSEIADDHDDLFNKDPNEVDDEIPR